MGALGPQLIREDYWSVQRPKGAKWIPARCDSHFMWNAITRCRYTKGKARVVSPRDRDGKRFVVFTNF
jgi:hypothetical protein